ncbi:MAG TPA: acyl-CoA dehydrogenase family protein [Myxococcales bacterium LLY-WYZ-16_1]|nr:acyl-CoA dehydrogenase family protein [Myxococcales bacterium LLY-WYZ-16_1]
MAEAFWTELSVELDDRLCELGERASAWARNTLRPREHEEDDRAARDFVRALGQAGFLRACTRLDVPAICVLRDVVARSSGLADSMLALQGLGFAPLVLAEADRWLGRYREGVEAGLAIAAFALSEPDAGSDVASLATRAVRDGSDWVLNGTKCWITNTGIADFYVVFARTGESGSKGISAFVVEADRVTRTERWELVAPHPCGAVILEDVRVPGDALLGEPGSGFGLAMRTLDHFRVTVGAAACGMAGRALDEAVERSRRRSQFGKPIGTFQQITAQLADSWVELSAARLLVFRAARAFEWGDERAGPFSSAAKLFATEAAQRIVDRAVQVFGGEGVRRNSPVERLYREVRALRIYEGTSEIQRLVIGRALAKGTV